MNKPFYIFLFLIVFCCEAKTQVNLVPNGSFEEIDSCHNVSAGFLSFPKGWFIPTTGSSDYFNSCDVSGYLSTPSNMFGFQVPFHGNSYVGFCVYTKNSEYSEYISVKLSKSLDHNTVYAVRYYLSLSESSQYAVNSVDAYFCKDSISSNNSVPLNFFTPQLKSNIFVSNKTGWTLIENLYTAQGGEKFIVIGNFKLNANTDTLSNDSLTNYSYYFIDSVGVYDLSWSNLIPNVFTPNKDGINDYWGINVYKNLMCKIYNRWGKEVFETNQERIKWDGTNSGIECAEGTYFYIIYTEEKIYKGYVQLIR